MKILTCEGFMTIEYGEKYLLTKNKMVVRKDVCKDMIENFNPDHQFIGDLLSLEQNNKLFSIIYEDGNYKIKGKCLNLHYKDLQDEFFMHRQTTYCYPSENEKYFSYLLYLKNKQYKDGTDFFFLYLFRCLDFPLTDEQFILLKNKMIEFNFYEQFAYENKCRISYCNYEKYKIENYGYSYPRPIKNFSKTKI